MDPNYLLEDEFLVELDIRDLDPNSPAVAEQLKAHIADELAGTRTIPVKIHSSFHTVTSELSAIQWKLSSIYIKNADQVELDTCRTRLLHLYGRLIRAEPRADGHRAVIEKLKVELEKGITNLSGRGLPTVDLVDNSFTDGANGVKDLPLALDGPSTSQEVGNSAPTAHLEMICPPVRTTNQEQSPSAHSDPGSLGPPYNTPTRDANLPATQLTASGLRQGIESLIASFPHLSQPPPPRQNANRHASAPVYSAPAYAPSAYAAPVHEALQPQRGQTTQTFTFDKCQLRFGGTSKDLPVDEFVFRIELLARNARLPESALTTYLHQLLVGEASSWYWLFMRNQPNANWEQIREELIAYFQYTVSDDAIRRMIMDRLQRPGERFMQFNLAVQALEVRLQVRMTERELLDTLRHNMLPQIQDRILFIQINSIRELQRCVQQVEELMQRQSEVQQIRRSMARIHEIAAFPPPQLGYHQGLMLPQTSFQQPPGNSVMPRVSTPSREDYGWNPAVEPPLPVSSFYPTPQYAEPSEFLSAVGNPSDRNQHIICWNCDEMGHTFVDCIAKRIIFCYGCGAKNCVRPQCPKCSVRSVQGNVMRSARPPGFPQIAPPQAGQALRPQIQPRPYQ